MFSIHPSLSIAQSFVAALVLAMPALGDSFAAPRGEMVERQLAARDIYAKDVLKVMGEVPRHRFVPEELRVNAYADTPLPIGHGQTISQPYIVALMTQLLDLQGGEKVLEIGTGSGYQAAVLAKLAREVYTIEIVKPLGRQAATLLKELGFENVQVRVGDGYQGWPEHAPFDAIIVTCSPEDVPVALVNQLKEGGRIVIPVGRWPDQTLYRLHKTGGRLAREAVAPVAFVPMVRSTPTAR